MFGGGVKSGFVPNAARRGFTVFSDRQNRPAARGCHHVTVLMSHPLQIDGSRRESLSGRIHRFARHDQRKSSAFPFGAFDGDASTEELGELLGDVKTHADAAVAARLRTIGLVKLIKNFSERIAPYAGAGVGNDKFKPRPRRQER